MTYDAGETPVPRRRPKRDPIPSLPRRVRAVVKGRVVAELAFGDDPGEIVPGSVVWLADPVGVSGVERELAVLHVVRVARLDMKNDFERVYAAIWDQAPDPGRVV